MDEVGHDEEELAQRLGDEVVLLGERLLVVAELPALGLALLGPGDVAGPPQLADLARQLVDPGARPRHGGP